jgi:hypothetical protein
VSEHSRSLPPSWPRTRLAGTESSPFDVHFPHRAHVAVSYTGCEWLSNVPRSSVPSDVFTRPGPAFVRTSASIYPFKLASASHLARHLLSHLVNTPVRTLSLKHHQAYTILLHIFLVFVVFSSLLRYQSMLEDELDRFFQLCRYSGWLFGAAVFITRRACMVMRDACRGYLREGRHYGYIVVGQELRKSTLPDAS